MKMSIVETTVEVTKEVASTVQETTMEKITTTIQEVTTAVAEAVTTIVENTTANSNSCSVWQGIYDVLDVINIILGIIVSATTIWIFCKTYLFKGVKFLSWNCGCSIDKGYTIGVVVQSRCLSTLSIKQISLLLDDGEEICLKDVGQISDEEHIIIEPFKTLKIVSDGSVKPLLNKFSLGEYKNLQLKFLFSDDSTKTVRFKHKKRKSINKKMKYPITTNYEGILCTKYLKFVIHIKDIFGNKHLYPVYIDGELENIFYGYKFLDRKVIDNVESLKMFVEKTIDRSDTVVDLFENPYCKDKGPTSKKDLDT